MSQGSLLSSSCKPLSFIHKTTHSKALVLDRRQSTHARRFPTASHFAPIRDGVVDRELPDRHAPELERSSLSRRILRRTRLRAPRWDVSEVSRTLSEIFVTLAIPEEDHFWRWHHPGRCPGGDQQPPQPPDHLIASAAWRPKSQQHQGTYNRGAR